MICPACRQTYPADTTRQVCTTRGCFPGVLVPITETKPSLRRAPDGTLVRGYYPGIECEHGYDLCPECDGVKCEGCGGPARHESADGYSLCTACYRATPTTELEAA